MSVNVYDTYVGSLNSGDAIIMDAVFRELHSIFPGERMVSYPTHYPLGISAVKRIRNSGIIFVGGTNLLTSDVRWRARSNQWAVGLRECRMLRDRAVLFGCGWKNYDEPTRLLARYFYKNILSTGYLHAVRDSFTELRMRELGMERVVTTGCPTLWTLTPEHCAAMPREKSGNVVFTLTDYRKDPARDTEMVETLLREYDKIYFWRQGERDWEYLQSLPVSKIQGRIVAVGASLGEYDRVLKGNESLDYVGTRLHAGIRALQMRRRSLILGVDNRAFEKQKDFGIAVLPRENIGALSEVVHSRIPCEIKLPWVEIEKWRNQFCLSKSAD